MRQALALLVLALLPSPSAASQSALFGGPDLAAHSGGPPGRFAFASYDSRQGLRNMATNFLVQDPTGYLWVGSEDGLYRYNGHRFQRYGAEDGLASSFVSALAVDADGAIWVGGAAGLARSAGARFERFDPASGLPTGAVQGLAALSDGSVLVASTAGLFRFAQGRFTAVKGFPAGEAGAVVAERNDTALAGQGPRVFRVVAQGVSQFWDLPDREARITGLVQDGQGRLFVSAGRRLFVRRADPGPFVEVTSSLPPLVEDSHLSLDARGRVWAPTVQGIYLCTTTTEQGPLRWKGFGAREGFPDAAAKAVFEDREGSLWISGSGLYRLLGRGLWMSYGRESGLPSDQAWSIHRDAGGVLFVGTNAGLARGGSHGFSLVPGTASHVVRAIASAPDGKLLFGGIPFELGVLDPRTGALTWLSEAAGLKGPHRLLAIQVAPDQTVWLATLGAGVLRSPYGQWRFEPVELPGGSADERLYDLLVDRAGRVWVSGQNGLAFLDRGVWRRLTPADGLKDTAVSYLALRGQHQVCAAYREPLGVTCLTPPAPGARPEIEHFDASRGLMPGRVYWMGEDRAGRFWFGTGTGVDVLGDDGVEHYGLREGLPGEDCSARAFLAEPNGDVWGGMSNGLARFVGAAYRALPVPRALIEEVRAGARAFPSTVEQPLRVPRQDNTLEFAFTGLSFVSETQVEHQVRLVGLEDWHPTEARTARYAALAPGEYRFEARARLGQGPWSAPATFSVMVLPAFWQLRWVQVSGALAVLVLLALGVRWRLRTLSRRNAALQQNNLALLQANEALTRARQSVQAATAKIEAEAQRLLATASRQTETANRQAAAVQEASATIKTIADASRASSERAGAVLEGAQQSDQDSQAGRRAVDEAVAAMQELAAQVAATAERMRSLAQRNEHISEIIDVVRELAERSNVLALNASLEAVRAGEHGRGFLVVAREMGQLADQSKQAASRVRAQLTEVQKETEAAVAETLESQRRAQGAMQAASAAGTTIAGLTDMIHEFALAARGIADGAQQQAGGVEETQKAVSQFAADMAETLEGAREIEQIAASLNRLSGGLVEALGRQGQDEVALAAPPSQAEDDLRRGASSAGSAESAPAA